MRPSDCLTRVGVLKIISSFPELFSRWPPKIAEIILSFPTTLKDQKEKATKKSEGKLRLSIFRVSWV